MTKLKVGMVGWRGMVGSVLVDRMQQEGDFDLIESTFFTTSQAGQAAPAVASNDTLVDAFDIESLQAMDVIITAQGGDYTNQVHPKLRAAGWNGYWIDAASSLRMNDDATLILDPVNRHVIDASLADGKKDYIGSNCTVSTMLMGLTGLFTDDLVEWVSTQTYQAASGAGASAMRELLQQMRHISGATAELLDDPQSAIMDIDRAVNESLAAADFPKDNFGNALAGNALPFIDKEVEDGMSREEWKGMVETNKILGTGGVAVDGTCVRIGAMRSHSHGILLKLKKDMPLEEIESRIADAHQWVKLIPNNKPDTIAQLTPANVSGSLNIHVGRLRKSKIGPEYLQAFVIGDQLLWGAAEPLRRMLRIIAEQK